MIKYFQFINGADYSDLMYISPKLLKVFAELSDYCYRNKIPLQITSMLRGHDNISKSITHQTGRAFDIRVKNMTEDQIRDVIRFLHSYDQINQVGAISKSTNTSRIVYRHDEHGDHLHIQVRP